MNSTLLTNESKTQTTDTSNSQNDVLDELYAVELAYVGGGMANVAFM